MSRRHLATACLLLFAAVDAWQFEPSTASADGWHNASLATASLDEWLQDVKTQIPDLEKKLTSAALQAGRNPDDLRKLAANASQTSDSGNAGGNPFNAANANRIQANYTADQRSLLGRKAMDCMEILAFMDPKNIFPREFPRFQLQRIPEYRKTAKTLLAAMGPMGGQAITNQIRAELMGNSALFKRRDIGPHKDYYKDLIEVLAKTAKDGNLSPDNVQALNNATSGKKPAAQARLAEQVRAILADNIDIPTLLKWHNSTDNRVQQKRIMESIQKRVATADIHMLCSVYLHEDISAALKQNVGRRLANRFREAPVQDLLLVMEQHNNATLDKAAQTELSRRSPTYSEVKEHLAVILGYRSSANKAAAAAADAQAKNAFQRAPMSQCLLWLEVADDSLEKLIWQQVDARIGRADASRRSGYRDIAARVLELREASSDLKLVAMDLMVRLKDPKSVGTIVRVLPSLRRAEWAAAGRTLRQLTGQDFGPKAGDGAAEVIVASKKWNEWWEKNKSRFP